MTTMRRLFASALLLSAAMAVPDTVDLKYSKYRGVTLSNGISQWQGIRYAAPPVGDLRFMPPQDPAPVEEVQTAYKRSKYCLETGAPATRVLVAEDCLFLNVQAPTNATEKSKLPVYLFIQGGGFNKNSDPNINASGLITASDHGIVVVDFNYRVGPYGFISDGHNITPNNGLLDQRKVMEWVQKHISKFGGDPDHVVLGGKSAGAESIALHLTAYNGTNKNLFHAAIAESPSFATMLTLDEAKYLYRNYATRLGCAGKHSLACMRNKTTVEIQEQNINIPFPGAASAANYIWVPVVDGSLVPDYQYRAFQKGNFVKVPTIFGDDANGGTIFTPRTAANISDSDQYILNSYPFLTIEQLGEINDLYPNPNKTCPNVGCYWRQVSNVYGEMRYTCPALSITATMAKSGVKNSYAYLWHVEDPAQVAEGLGVPHTVEFQALLGPGYAPSLPESYNKGGVNEKAPLLIQYYWLNFIRTFNPNKAKKCSNKQTPWKRWSDEAHSRLVFQTGGTSEMVEVSNDQKARCDYWVKNGISMRL